MMLGSFQRPLGLVLAGGGALGSWQAGCLQALCDWGLTFDAVLGFSAGSLTGTAYAFGLQDELLERWRNIDKYRLLRFSPSLRTMTLYSGQPLWDMVRPVADDEAAKARCRADFTVMSLCREDEQTRYSRFTPGGAQGWDGPLAARLVSSCAIPGIFPHVAFDEPEGRRTYADGGLPGVEWMNWAALAHCRDIVVLEMVRPEEARFGLWLPRLQLEKRGRRLCRRQIDEAHLSLAGQETGTRVFRVYPSRRLNFSMLAFKTKFCAPALEQGLEDGAAFVKAPASALSRPPAPAPEPAAAPQLGVQGA